MGMVAAVFRTIFAQPDATTVAATWEEVRDQLTKSFPRIGSLMDDAKTEVLAFTAFPRAHWSKTWSTNPLSVNRPSGDTVAVAGWGPEPAVGGGDAGCTTVKGAGDGGHGRVG